MRFKICLATAVLSLGCGPSEKEKTLEKELTDIQKQQIRIIAEKEQYEKEFVELRIKQERLLIQLEKTQQEFSEIKKIHEKLLFEKEYNARKEEGSKKSSEECKVSGNVFIATKGGQNIKLGLVHVSATPLSNFEEMRAAKIAAINAFIENNQSQFNDLIEKYRAEEKKFDALSAKLKQKTQQISDYAHRQGVNDGVIISSHIITSMSKSGNNNAFIYRRELNLMVDEANEIIIQMEPVYKRMMDIAQKIKPISREASEIYDNRLKHFLKSLEPNSVVALSNADGNFTIKLARNNYVLTALSNREIGNQVEVYSWIKKLNADTTESEISIVLANDSLVESIPGDSSACEKLARFHFGVSVYLPSRFSEYTIKEY